ncbi:MAG TPA: type II toxin-antitoxin system RelE/ParE family toxin [Thermoanaerobaculia bacterium]
MAYKVAWAESALDDLTEAVEYIARDSPGYAASVATRAVRAAESLSELPHRGRRVPEFHDEHVREIIVVNYRMIYHVSATMVNIIAFVHAARDLAAYVRDHT